MLSTKDIKPNFPTYKVIKPIYSFTYLFKFRYCPVPNQLWAIHKHIFFKKNTRQNKTGSDQFINTHRQKPTRGSIHLIQMRGKTTRLQGLLEHQQDGSHMDFKGRLIPEGLWQRRHTSGFK